MVIIIETFLILCLCLIIMSGWRDFLKSFQDELGAGIVVILLLFVAPLALGATLGDILANIAPIIALIIPLLFFLNFEIIHSFISKNNIVSTILDKYSRDFVRNIVFGVLLFSVAIYFKIRWHYYSNDETFFSIIYSVVDSIGSIFLNHGVLFSYTILFIYVTFSAVGSENTGYKKRDWVKYVDVGEWDDDFVKWMEEKDEETKEKMEDMSAMAQIVFIIFLIIDIFIL